MSTGESHKIEKLFDKFLKQTKHSFPPVGETVKAPKDCHGVYIIRNAAGVVEYVGMSVRAKGGLFQRLQNHIRGESTYTRNHYGGKGMVLRGGYTFQYLVVEDMRERTLLEYLATGKLCPVFLEGEGKKTES